MSPTPPKSKTSNRLGATPGKLALTAVLAVVFAYVVFGNTDTPAEVATAPQRKLPTKVQAAPAKAPAAAAEGQLVERKPWPQISVDVASRTDPFSAKLPGDDQRLARTDAAFTTDSEQVTLDDIRGANAAIVLLSGDSKIARYGTKELRVGDRVEGYRVRDISTEGVILSEQP